MAHSSLEDILLLNDGELEALFDALPSDGMEDQIALLMDIEQAGEIPEECPEGLLEEIWDVISFADDKSDPHSLRMARITLIVFILNIDDSFYYLTKGDLANSILAYGQANFLLGMSLSRFGAAYGKGSIYEVAKSGAESKLKSDPKQQAKKQVRECWFRWQTNPSEYKSKASFARNMLDKFEELESQRVIERWCKEWEEELNRQST